MRIFIFERGLSHAPTEYSQYLIYPYNAEYSHDNALGAASVTLRNMEREETFAPGTVVMIGDGSWKDNTCDQWVIVNTARGTNHANGKHTHTLYLSDLTKLLERDVIGNKTFTRSIVVSDIAESKTFSAFVGDTSKDFVGIQSPSGTRQSMRVVPPMMISPIVTTNIPRASFVSVFPFWAAAAELDESSVAMEDYDDEFSVTIKLNGKIYQKWSLKCSKSRRNGC